MKGSRVSRVTKNWGVVLVLFISFAGLLSCDCGTEPGPPDNGADTTGHPPDTTSHDFIWEIDTLGDGSGGSLEDVVIINDTLAYAVGEIYLKDSTGQIDPNAFNLAKWNGTTWVLSRIQFYTVCGQASRTPYPASAVWAFNSSDVWIAMIANQVVRWNGNVQTATMCLPVSFRIRKLWGYSPNSVYAVGDGGNICYYDGSSWRRVESGISDPVFAFTDIWGATRSTTGSPFVVAVGSVHTRHESHRVVALSPTSIIDTLQWIYNKIPFGVWFDESSPIYVSGEGLYRYDGSSWAVTDSVTNFHRVRGNGGNDIFIFAGGNQTTLRHYNGSTWWEYPEVQMQFAFARGLDFRGSTVMGVGSTGDIPYVIRGYRR